MEGNNKSAGKNPIKEKEKVEMAEIDGIEFPVEMDGMVLVDAYYVPKEEAEAYRKEREYYAEKAKEVFSEFCAEVTRDWKGSQDGEGILGLDSEGTLVAVVHLDPHDIDMMKEAEKNQGLRSVLLEYNEINDQRYQQLKADKQKALTGR